MDANQLNELADNGLIGAFQERIRRLETKIEEMSPIVDAAVEWRRDGYARKADFCVGIGPLLDAIDIYDVGAKRPCDQL